MRTQMLAQILIRCRPSSRRIRTQHATANTNTDTIDTALHTQTPTWTAQLAAHFPAAPLLSLHLAPSRPADQQLARAESRCALSCLLRCLSDAARVVGGSAHRVAAAVALGADGVCEVALDQRRHAGELLLGHARAHGGCGGGTARG